MTLDNKPIFLRNNQVSLNFPTQKCHEQKIQKFLTKKRFDTSYQSWTTVTKHEGEAESILRLYFLSWRSGELSFSYYKQFCKDYFSKI